MASKKKVVAWVALNSLFCYGLYEAYSGSAFAENAVTFAVWFMAVVYVMGAVSRDTLRADQRVRSVPAALAMAMDMACIVVMAGIGWFWTAAAMSVSMVCESAIYDDKKEPA